MKTLLLNKHEQMLFALLRASLNERDIDISYFQDISDEDWNNCYHLSIKQGVMALAWDSVMKLPSNLLPPLSLKLTWASRVESYEKTYEKYCKTAVELSDYYAEYGISMMQIKGVGFSLHYPIPSHREGGDVDIYTFSADSSKLTNEEANNLADELIKRQGIDVGMHSYKHTNFHYKGIPFENHKYFLNVEHYPIAVQANECLKQCMQPQVTRLLNGRYQILTPSPAFNTLFLAFHASQHYGNGIALHHLCDWAMQIKHHGIQIPQELTDKRFLKAIIAFTQICKRYLGIEIDMTEDTELTERILDEVLHPRYPHKAGVPVKGKLNILFYKAKRFWYHNQTCNLILHYPLWKRVWASIVAHIRHPETIFRTEIK